MPSDVCAHSVIATRRVDARELLDGERVGERVAAAAAVLLGERDPHQPELAELGDDLVRERLRRGRAPRRPGATSLLGEVADGAAGSARGRRRGRSPWRAILPGSGGAVRSAQDSRASPTTPGPTASSAAATASISPGVRGLMATARRSVTRFVRRALIAGVVARRPRSRRRRHRHALPRRQHGRGPPCSPRRPSTATRGPRFSSPHPQAVEPEAGVPAGEQSASTTPSGAAAGTDSHSPTDAEIRRELAQLKHLAGGRRPPGRAPSVACSETARGVAPQDAPQIVRDVIRAGNVIANTPYLWGGGHGRLSASAMTARARSPSPSHGAGLLDAPLTRGRSCSGAAPAPGAGSPSTPTPATSSWRSPASASTPGAQSRGSGTRWQATGRSTNGFVARHPAGL